MRRVVTILVAMGALLLLGMSPAQAHSELESSNPAADSVMDYAPAGVELVFNQKISDQFANVTVTAPDGTQVGDPKPTVEGERALLPIQDGIPSGQYTVGYRVISEDGHPITGSFSFTLALTETPAPVAGAASTTPIVPVAADASDDAGTGSSMVLPILGGVVALLFVLGIVIVLRGERRKKD
ncbi:copper resistance CopC family protein [Rhodococcus opacus]|uniref:copper resistance CopC family protein n=1 Tax=Rhodococcus opacus TaxID=37919 RepID=UPI001C43812F|nr:copper resistance CopC family protein [Rhodococcus opacus]MBV6760611.1 copper resistance protein CopC [Rhodococcus opacus]